MCALKIEIAPMLAKCEQVRAISGGKFRFRGGYLRERKLAVVESGAGGKLAARATHALLDAHTPNWVLSVGFSGALVDDMRKGDIVVANELTSADGGRTLTLDINMPPDPEHGLHVGKLVMHRHIVRQVEEKRALHEATGGIAVDLESLEVAEVCRERKVKFMAVRVISDDMTADLPPEVLSILGSKGTIRAGAMVGAIWNRPGSVFDMWNLRESANASAERLAEFLAGILETLARSST